MLACLAGGIRARQEAGEVRDDLSAEDLARLLVAVTDGLQVQSVIDPGFDSADLMKRVWSSMAGSPAGETA